MADVQPIRTLRYEPEAAGPLEDLIAPPYDVIDDDLRAELAARSPHNVVEIDLPETYEGAAEKLGEWREQGVLVSEDEPAIWVLRQDYTAPDGSTRTRTGFFARVRVEDYGAGRIRPHERTHPGPKEDRLKLTRATRANLSPIFSLFPDAGGAATETLAHATSDEPFAEVTDHEGTRNTLWRVADPEPIAALQAALADAELLIADGHHRYETARAYADELGGEGDHRYVLMFLVALDDPGLLVFPTHRLLTGLKDDAEKQIAIRDTARRDFDIEELDDPRKLEPPARERARDVRLHGQLLQAAVPLHPEGPVDRRRRPGRHAGAVPPPRHRRPRGGLPARRARHERGRHLAPARPRLLEEPRGRHRARGVRGGRRRLLHAGHPGRAGARGGPDGGVDAAEVDLLLPEGPDRPRVQSTGVKIYTRKGDDGTTGLWYGGRVAKFAGRPEAYGSVDEAASALGLARAAAERGGELYNDILRFQNELFVAGAELATAPEAAARLQAGVSKVTADMVERLESDIDRYMGRVELPPKFVIPGGTELSARLDVARAAVRRAERRVAALKHAGDLADDIVLTYLNRLSDAVYAMARFADEPEPELFEGRG